MSHTTFRALGQPARGFAAGLAAALLAAACGGGSSPPAVVAAADSLTIAAGASGQLLSNDTIGGNAARAGTGGNVSFTLTTGTLPSGVTVSEGTVAVASTANPGSLSLSYRICEPGSSENCATAAANVTIPAPPIAALADSFNLGSGQTGDVLANDTLGGTPVNATRVSVAATATLPTGLALSATGIISNNGSAASGTYPVGYRICQLVAPTNCATATAQVTVPALSTLTGRAVDSATGVGLAGVRVSVGGLNATTDASGTFNLASVPPSSRVVVVFKADTHAETARIASIAASATADVQARMVRVGQTTDLAIATGGTVSISGSPAQVTVGAAAVQRADGSLPSGNMRVRLTAINPAVDSQVMPGDFTTLVAGNPALIESFGALNVQLADSAGNSLNLRPGQLATVRIALASRSTNAPTTIPLFHFDNATGRWAQEGSATLAGTGTNRYYEGTVSHFSTWNADLVMDTVRLSGCVVDALGVRVAGARIFSDGIDYSGISSAQTDASGAFSIALRRGGVATLVGQLGTLLTNTLRVGPAAVDGQLANCLSLGTTAGGITMKLTWGQIPADLDSHLRSPSGAHVYWDSKGSLTGSPFANLDVDDTTSFGPEVVTITKLEVGRYRYYIHNFSGFNSGPIASSGAQVELNLPGRTPELFSAPPSGETTNTVWMPFELEVDARCNVTLLRATTTYVVAPTVASNTPVYCQP